MQAPGREARQHEAEQQGQTKLRVAHANHRGLGLHRNSLHRRRDHRHLGLHRGRQDSRQNSRQPLLESSRGPLLELSASSLEARSDVPQASRALGRASQPSSTLHTESDPSGESPRELLPFFGQSGGAACSSARASEESHCISDTLGRLARGGAVHSESNLGEGRVSKRFRPSLLWTD
jgi:hypothetical protein